MWQMGNAPFMVDGANMRPSKASNCRSHPTRTDETFPLRFTSHASAGRQIIAPL